MVLFGYRPKTYNKCHPGNWVCKSQATGRFKTHKPGFRAGENPVLMNLMSDHIKPEKKTERHKKIISCMAK
jgi:hypothetical protein